MEKQISENDAQQAQLEAEALSRIKLPLNTKKTEVLVKHIRDAIHKDSSKRNQCAAHLDLGSRYQAHIMIANRHPQSPRNR